MENGESVNNETDSQNDVTPLAPKKKSPNQQEGTNRGTTKPVNNRKRSLRELWRNASALRKAELILHS